MPRKPAAAAVAARKPAPVLPEPPPSELGPERFRPLTIRLTEDNDERLRLMAFKTRKRKWELLNAALEEYLQRNGY